MVRHPLSLSLGPNLICLADQLRRFIELRGKDVIDDGNT